MEATRATAGMTADGAFPKAAIPYIKENNYMQDEFTGFVDYRKGRKAPSVEA